MNSDKICLASDNWSPVHPLVMQEIINANENNASAYGADSWTSQAIDLIQAKFNTDCKVLFVPTGTGSNVLALKLCCLHYESVICTDIAHVYYQESGATEAIVGCKFLTIDHHNGKVLPDRLIHRLQREKAFGRHSTSPRVLSISQPTEVGTVYSIAELQVLAKICREQNLLLHVDGSRFYHALVELDVSFSELIQFVPLDILSLGGTKNGLMQAEALVIFNPILKDGSDYLQKQTLQLLSKMRYLSAQYIPFFRDDLWHTLAVQANKRAKEIALIIQQIPLVKLSYPVETNQVFFTVPISWIQVLQENIFFHIWDQTKAEIRFVTSWNTSQDDIDRLRIVFAKILKDPI